MYVGISLLFLFMNVRPEVIHHQDDYFRLCMYDVDATYVWMSLCMYDDDDISFAKSTILHT